MVRGDTRKRDAASSTVSQLPVSVPILPPFLYYEHDTAYADKCQVYPCQCPHNGTSAPYSVAVRRLGAMTCDFTLLPVLAPLCACAVGQEAVKPELSVPLCSYARVR